MRVQLVYDDGSKIDFGSKEDAAHHVRVQGFAGVVELRQESNGKVLLNRERLVNLATGEE